MLSDLRRLLFTLSILLLACGRSAPTAGRTGTPSPAGAGDGSAASASSAAARERKLVRGALLRLEVDEYAAARAHLDAELERVGGHVAQARVEHADGAVASAALELRLPAAEVDGFLRRAAHLGSVLEESVHATEITDEYYDAAARLENARRLERRLLDFADTKTSDVKGLLEVERELARVREDVETLQGRITRWDASVTLASVSIELTSRQRVSVGGPPALRDDLAYSFQASWWALARAGRGALVAGVWIAPWLPPFALFAYAARRAARRWRLAR